MLLDFDLPSELTDRVKRRVRAASKFILYHELAHFLRFHHDLLEHWPFPSIPRRSELGATIAAYRRKAFEVDADAFAFSLLLNEAYNFTNGFVPSSVAELYRDIALIFCCFDGIVNLAAGRLAD